VREPSASTTNLLTPNTLDTTTPYLLIYGAGNTPSLAGVTVDSNGVGAYVPTYSTVDGALEVSFASSSNLYWTGSQSSTWSTAAGGFSNFSTDAAGTDNSGITPTSGSNVILRQYSDQHEHSLGANTTINSLEFTGAGTTAGSNSVTIGGTNTLTINAAAVGNVAAGTGITIDTGSANHTISAPVALGASQAWTVTDVTNTLTVSGNVSDGGAKYTLTKAGAGALVLSGSNTYGGGTAVNAGTLEVSNSAGSATGSGSVAVNMGDIKRCRHYCAIIDRRRNCGDRR